MDPDVPVVRICVGVIDLLHQVYDFGSKVDIMHFVLVLACHDNYGKFVGSAVLNTDIAFDLQEHLVATEIDYGDKAIGAEIIALLCDVVLHDLRVIAGRADCCEEYRCENERYDLFHLCFCLHCFTAPSIH